MATMSYNSGYATSYGRSTYSNDFSFSRRYSGATRNTGDTYASSRNDLPGVHTTRRFQSPVRRDSDSASNINRSTTTTSSRPLPPRPSYPSTYNDTHVGSNLRSTKGSSETYGSHRVLPLKAENTDAYKKSVARTKATQIPSVHSTSTADSPLIRTSTFGKYSSSINNSSPLSESERVVRRRSASVGATARNVANSMHNTTSQVATEKNTNDNEKDKKDKLTSRTEQVSSDSTNNSNDTKQEGSSSARGQILGGTASDDYRNRGNGPQLTSSVEADRSTLPRRDSTSDYMVSGYRLSDRGAVGLDNLGNTCFMNSILQCLSNTRPLLEYCLNGSYVADVNKKTSQMNGQMIKAYAQLMRSMWDSSKSSSVAPTEFKSQVSRFARQFVGYSQHDAHEFLIYLLEGLNEEVNRIQEKKKRYIDCSNEVETISAAEKAKMSWQKYVECDNSKIIDVFAGQLKSALTCNECGYISNTFDPFLVMSLPIKKKGLWSDTINLAECFDLFTQEETLSGDDRPTCARCRCRRACNKRFSIQRFPRILVIHLKRFNQGSSYSKLRTEVNCPPTGLDLTKYSADNLNQPVVYNLYAVSNHSGTMLSGHYTAYAKSPYSSQWYTFNDSRATPMRLPKLTSDAYLLFYELQD